MMRRHISSCVIAVVIGIILLSCKIEGKCKCVDYDRDWYVVVASFASGLVLSGILAFLLNCYYRRCGRIKPLVITSESQEALETQNGADFNPFYEEVPGGENDGFEAIGSFEQTFRSDSMDSRTNLVVHHGEPSKPAEYQHPRIVMEPIYSDCGMVDGKSNGQSGAEEHSGATEYGESSNTASYQHPRTGQSGLEATGGINEDGESTSVTNYQHPKPDLERSYSEISLTDQVSRQGEASIPGDYQEPKTKPEHTYSECEVVTQDGNPALQSRAEVTPSKPPRYSKPLPPSSRKSEAPPNYQIPSPISQHASPTKYQIPPGPKSAPPSPKLIPSSPPSGLATEDKSRHASYQYPAPTNIPSTEENPPTSSKSQPPSPALSNKKSNRDANCQLPEIDAEFLEIGDNNLQDETSAPITIPPSSTGANQTPPNSQPPPSPSGNEESNRDSNYDLPEIDMKFLESGDKSLIQPSSSQSLTLALRTPSQKSPSARPTITITSSAPPLPSKTSPLKSPIVGKLILPSSSSPPALPSRTRLSPKSPSSGLTSSPPPVLPSKTSSKSPAMVPSSSSTPSEEVPPIPPKVARPVSPTLPSKTPKPQTMLPSTSATPPPVPPKATPPLPAKTKPASPPSPAVYAELNELDRQDDTANYEHLYSMFKQ